VRFNGTTATFIVNSSSQITTTVPLGATSGPLTVATPAGTVQSAASFLVVAAPNITGFSPASGGAGSVVAITGNGLLTKTPVTFNGLNAAAFNILSATQIAATAPPNVTTGPIRVTSPGGTAQSATAFTVQAAPANDNFASAQVITGGAGTVSG